mmetsp:Transcript_53218/g.88447  ORF Transcript_53218/g.88447 Transcript_53218/m.88447 type:complete len:130 (-) Transcript_53218:19-408(-)
MAKPGPTFSERLRNFRNPCGYGCSICCIIFSTWGAIMLTVLGILLWNNYVGIDGVVPSICGDVEVIDRTTEVCAPYHKSVAKQTWIAAIVYVFFILLSVLRIVHLKVLERSQATVLDSYAGVDPVVYSK